MVWTLHDCWPFTGHCAYYDYAGCSRWESGCRRCPQKRAYPASLLADASSRNYAGQAPPVHRVELSDAGYSLPSGWRGEVVPFWKGLSGAGDSNGIDLTAFRPTEETGAVRRRFGIPKGLSPAGVAGVWEARKDRRISWSC